MSVNAHGRKRVCSSATAFALLGLLNGCSTTDSGMGQASSDLQSRGMPQMQQPKQTSGGASGEFRLPTWPQKWQLNNREPAGFGFGVTQPGPISVNIQSQGAPVVVELYSAAPPAVQRQTGSGVIRLAYQVTPADVQRGVLWLVRIALAQPGGPPAQATGTIAIQSPQTDMNVLRAQIQARIAQRRAIDPQTAAAMKATMDASSQAVMTKFQQEEAARRAAVAAEGRARPLIAGAAPSGQIMPRSVEEDSGAVKDQGTTSEGDVSSRALLPPRDLSTREKMFTPVPPPYITGFSQWQALPGDRVSIQGTAFSNSPSGGQVLVVLKTAAGDVQYVAPVQTGTWTDTQIDINVPPEITGIPNVTNADVVVVRGPDQRQSDPRIDSGGFFRVAPAMDLLPLPLPPPFGESLVQAPATCLAAVELSVDFSTGCVSDPSVSPGWFNVSRWWVYSSRADWLGYRGNDTFFVNKQLKNNWKVFSADIQLGSYNLGITPSTVWCPTVFGSGNAYVAESRVGTTSPYLNVRVWLEPFCAIHYTPVIWVKGPRGLPY